MPCGVRIRNQVSRRPAQRSLQLQNLTILIVKSCSILNRPPSLQVFSGARENVLAQSESNVQSSRGGWEHLEVLRSTGEGYRSVWEVCIWLADRITFCRWRLHSWNSQRLRNDGNTRINKVLAMRTYLAKIIEKVCISWYFERPEIDIHIAENARCVHYVDTWLLKQVHHCQRANVAIAVLPSIDVKTHWNSTRLLLERAYGLWEYTCEWLQNPQRSDYRSLITIQYAVTIGKYVIVVSGPFQSWTVGMLKKNTVTLHNVITVYDDMFNHMNGVMQPLDKKNTE